MKREIVLRAFAVLALAFAVMAAMPSTADAGGKKVSPPIGITWE